MVGLPVAPPKRGAATRGLKKERCAKSGLERPSPTASWCSSSTRSVSITSSSLTSWASSRRPLLPPPGSPGRSAGAPPSPPSLPAQSPPRRSRPPIWPHASPARARQASRATPPTLIPPPSSQSRKAEQQYTEGLLQSQALRCGCCHAKTKRAPRSGWRLHTGEGARQGLDRLPRNRKQLYIYEALPGRSQVLKAGTSCFPASRHRVSLPKFRCASLGGRALIPDRQFIACRAT